MWTDWQGTSPEKATQYIGALQAAKLSGQPVEIIIAGVKTRLAESSVDPQLTIGMRLAELQEYLWRITPEDEGGGGVLYTLPIRPRAYRNRQTTIVNC